MATVTIGIYQNNNQYNSAYQKFFGRVVQVQTVIR